MNTQVLPVKRTPQFPALAAGARSAPGAAADVLVCGRGGVGKDFFLDLLSLQYLWDVNVEIGCGFSSEIETSNRDLKIS